MINDNHKIIAVFGNSGSFKTATSINLAKAISKKDSNAKIAVIGLDHTKPLIPLIFPDSASNLNLSLGKLLSGEIIDPDAVFSQMNICDRFSNIGILGYNSGENIQSYAFPTSERVDDFLMQMRHLVNYTIIDCTSELSYRLTAKSLINADNVLYLISCDINGLVFHQSQEPILLGEQYGYNNYLKCLTISGRFAQDENAMQNALVQVDGIIPYSENLAELWNQGKGLSVISDVNYNNVIEAIADEFINEFSNESKGVS